MKPVNCSQPLARMALVAGRPRPTLLEGSSRPRLLARPWAGGVTLVCPVGFPTSP